MAKPIKLKECKYLDFSRVLEHIVTCKKGNIVQKGCFESNHCPAYAPMIGYKWSELKQELELDQPSPKLKGEQNMNKQLNIRLAEWAGFVQVEYRWHPEPKEVSDWLFPNKVTIGRLPDFTQDFSICLEWLMPKLNAWTLSKQAGEREYKARVFINGTPSETGWGDNPALALCRAIQTLIDPNWNKGE